MQFACWATCREKRCWYVHGKTVLVIGATSAVGHYAVQMAVLAVATVIGTVGSAERVQHALAAGVATTIH